MDLGLATLALVGFGMVTALTVFVYKPEFEGRGNREALEIAETTSTPTTFATPVPTWESNGRSQVWRKLILYQPMLGDKPSQGWFDLESREKGSVTLEIWPETGFYVNFEKEVLSVHAVDGVDPYELGDVDIGFVFDFTSSVGEFGLVCRMQPNHNDMYVLMVSEWEWRLVRTLEGNEIILAQGVTNEEFRKHRAGVFWLHCEGGRLTVWDQAGLKAIVMDNTLEKGATGILLTNPEGKKGYLQINTEHVSYLYEDQEVGRAGDTVQAVDLFVTVTQPSRMIRSGSEGSHLVAVKVFLHNRGFEPIIFQSYQVYLEVGGRKISALDIEGGGGGGPVRSFIPLDFPYELGSYEWRNGDVVFEISDDEDLVGDLTLVIDLSEQGYAPIRFDLSH